MHAVLFLVVTASAISRFHSLLPIWSLMKRMRISLFLVFSPCQIVSCSKHDESSGIIVYCDSSKAVELDPLNDNRFSSVDLNPVPLKFPDHVVINDDGTFFLKTSDTLFRYSLSDGHRVGTYSRRGRALNEFVRLSSYSIDQDSLYLYDSSSKKVLIFNINDSYPSRVIQNAGGEAFFEAIERVEDSSWVGKRIGGMPDVPELGLYDNEFKFITTIGERTLRSGLGIGHPFSRNGEGALFTMAYSNDVQQITSENCYVKYRIRYSEGTLDPDNYNDEYEMNQDRLVRQKAGDSFSCLPARIIDDDQYLTFIYLNYFGGVEYTMYAVYDKRRNECKCFRILSPEDWTVFMIRHNETVYCFAYYDGGFRVYSLPFISLIKQ